MREPQHSAVGVAVGVVGVVGAVGVVAVVDAVVGVIVVGEEKESSTDIS